MTQRLTIGRIVRYRLTEEDARYINENRPGLQSHEGFPVNAWNEVPCLITRVEPGLSDHYRINGQCILDGNDSLWVRDIREGIEPGTWHWPPREPPASKPMIDHGVFIEHRVGAKDRRRLNGLDRRLSEYKADRRHKP